MNKKYLIIVILFLVFICVFNNCKEVNMLKGEWQFVYSSGCDKNPLGLFAEVWPHSEYGHKIYFEAGNIVIPSIMLEDGSPFMKGCYTESHKLSIATLGIFDYILENDTLQFTRNSCLMKFVEISSSDRIVNTTIKFERKGDNGELKDSLLITKKEVKNQLSQESIVNDYDFILKLSNLIKKKDRDGNFGKSSNDVDCYYIELTDKYGKISNIQSCGKLETPFEIRTLIRYINKL